MTTAHDEFCIIDDDDVKDAILEQLRNTFKKKYGVDIYLMSSDQLQAFMTNVLKPPKTWNSYIWQTLWSTSLFSLRLLLILRRFYI